MAITIEGFTVVALHDRIQHLLEDGTLEAPNATALTDKHFWKCSFMAAEDALKFRKILEDHGLNGSQGPDSDIVLVSEFDRSVDPYCEWIQTGVWEKAVIAWKVGTEPTTVVAREGWDPNVGSGLQFHDKASMRSLQFLRLQDNLEVFLNTETGKEVYIGRTSTPVDSLFQVASEIIRKHYVAAGQPSVTGDAATEVAEAAGMLEKVIAEVPDWWNARWFHGKSQLALGNHKAAYDAFHAAYRIEKNVEYIQRELGGVCLELGKFDEAVTIGEAALALDASNAELLGNLAISYLLAGRAGHARKAIDAATKIDPEDNINRTISRILGEIENGSREMPASLRDLSKPAKPPAAFARCV
ncbi:MAG: tetratricopeptide repeat protein [Verrucomicrobiaceae bacterium]|nr:MAG: tetratricopeptide repeat protein [Verrucomicrobiaceae bacterium]